LVKESRAIDIHISYFGGSHRPIALCPALTG